MGGYRAADGRALKWRHLYRSGVMSGLSEAGRAELSALGIRVICDLRGNDERRRRPMVWHEAAGIDYWSRDYDLSLGNLQALAQRGSLSEAATLELIHEIYRLLPYEQADSYRELFRRLAAGQVPLLFNCSAGKDRTGIAAALVLSALGVPRETIREDYAMTDHAIDRLITLFLEDPRHIDFRVLSQEQFLPMLRADPAYLDIMFDEIERRHGSVEGYLGEVLGIGEAEISAIREHLLEPAGAG
jgi:protein-tyrosine phosphatase